VGNLTGQNLGPYRILEQIGLGGMATVYRAYQPSMDRQVAVKVLPAHFMQDPTFVERFEREAHTIARLAHPHILPVHDYGKSDDGTTYIVMRYVEAGTLADLLRRGPMPLGQTTQLFYQVGDALAYAHEQGVIHRDMKPSNVLVDPRDQAFLTDFGLARMVESSSHLTGSMVVGTPAYMAPEQGEGLPATQQSDIYSLGVVLYEMVTGRPPFEAETPLAVMIKHMTEPLPLPRELNPDLTLEVERVILRALAKEPQARYQDAKEMVQALRRAVRASTTATGPQSSPAPTEVAPPPKRPLWPWLGSIVGGAALLIVLGILALFLSGLFSSDEGQQPAPLLDPTVPVIAGAGVGASGSTRATCSVGIVAAAAVVARTVPVIAGAGEVTAEPPAQQTPGPIRATTAAAATIPTEQVALVEPLAPTPAPASGWTHFSNTGPVTSIALQGDLIWVGTEGGLIAWNREDQSYQRFTTLDGLPNHTITTLLATEDGTLWAGTAGGGVGHYDGGAWQAFDSEDGLTADDVSSLYVAVDGTLLASTLYDERGISLFDGEDWRAADLPPLPVDSPQPVALAQDAAGGLVVGLTDEGGLLYYDGQAWKHYTQADGLPSNSITSLAVDQEDNLWLATSQRGGIGLFDGETFATIEELADLVGTVIYVDPEGTVWIGTEDTQLWYLDGDKLDHYDLDDGLPPGAITGIVRDQEGVLWLGIYGWGLVRFDGQDFETWALVNEPAFNVAAQILEAADGRLGFVEKWGGDNIAIYDPQTATWDTLQAPGYTQVLALDPHGPQSVWFGTDEGLWRVTPAGARRHFSTDEGLPGEVITALIFDENGGLWVGMETGLAYLDPGEAGGAGQWQDLSAAIPSPHVRGLYPNPEGGVWIATARAGDRPAGLASAVDGRVEAIWLAGQVPPETLGPAADTIAGQPFPATVEAISAVAVDGQGTLWAGTEGGGLWRWQPDSGWRLFDDSDGAPSVWDYVLSIAAYPDGTVWFGTDGEGLWGFRETEGWWQLTPDDGLPGWIVYASHVARDGSLWLATESGLARYVPE
jgi:ligand-binding sensor domain-containing protein/tRNA A-37 threonylcarbamoyl transferase component Bud32